MRIFFLIKEGVAAFNRARLASVISVVTITLSLTLLGIFGALVENLAVEFHKFYQHAQLEVFVNPAISPGKLKDLQDYLKSISAVDSVRYVSAQEALRQFEKDFGQDLAAILEENPLPPSFRVSLKTSANKMEAVEDLITKIRSRDDVDDVIFARKVFKLVNRYFWVGVISILLIGLVIFIISILLVFNTIRLTIHARRSIIEIMKLVGATRMFIKAPYLIEGLIQGAVGGLLAALLLRGLENLVRIVISPQVAVAPTIFIFLFSLGIVLGFLGSYISINKYLHY